MSGGHRGLILEIQGSEVNFISEPGLPVSWGTGRTGLVVPPSSPTLSIDPRSFEADAGGTSVMVLYIDDLLQQYKTSPLTLLTQDADLDDSVINVEDTSDYPSTGTIWLGKNAILYAGKTSTTFTGCLWGRLGTAKADELAGAVVYGFNPEILDRQVWLYWYNFSTASKVLRFTGYLDDIEIMADGTMLSILSAKKKLIEQPALGKPYAEGYLLQDMAAPHPVPLLVSFLDPNNPIDNNNGLLDRLHLRIDDEVIEYGLLLNPRLTAEIDSIPGTNQVRTGPEGAGFFPSELVDIQDGSTVEDTVQITKVEMISLTVYEISYTTSTGDTPSAGDDLVANYSANINTLKMVRGAVDTEPAEHKAGTRVGEVRVLEGDQLEDILFPLLFSLNGNGTAGPDSGKYDRLPPGWGLGLDASLVDVDGLRSGLQGRTAYRRYVFDKPLEIEQMLRWISVSTNNNVFWNHQGVLTCVARTSIYPGMSSGYRLSLPIDFRRVPSMRIASSHIINSVEWSTDYTIDGEPTRIIVVEERESNRVRTRHKGEPMEDPGVLARRAREQMYVIHKGLLVLRSRPVPVIELDVAFDEDNPYLPGELVLLDISAFPNLQGGQDLLDAFEIIDVSPADPQGMVSLTLMMRASLARVGLISIWSEVSTKEGNNVTLKQQSQTHAAPPGTEDVTLWDDGDKIEFWDVSSFGSGSVNRFATTISSIDIGSRILGVAAVPSGAMDGWTLASGDLVRLDDHTTVAAGPTADERIGVYIALSTTPRYVWGV